MMAAAAVKIAPMQTRPKKSYRLHKQCSRAAHIPGIKFIIFILLPMFLFPQNVSAQDWPSGWGVDLTVPAPVPDGTQQNTPGATTPQPPVTTDTTDNADAPAILTLQARITDDGQQIRQGLVWRIFKETESPQASSKLTGTHKQPSPVLTLKPGRYAINVSFGRANLTKRITLQSGQQATEQFVLNAGGLKLIAMVGDKEPISNSVTYQVLDGEPDQSGQRAVVISEARPGLIIRLNAGIYHIVSRYGDANATISTDITVEAGKLTVAKVSHSAASVTFKLVARPGGEALPQTRWTIETKDGTIIKKSVGALPTHILAPGLYVVTAQNAEHVFKNQFQVEAGQIASVEVIAQ